MSGIHLVVVVAGGGEGVGVLKKKHRGFIFEELTGSCLSFGKVH